VTDDQVQVELATAGVAGAVANVLREVYRTGTDAEIRVARRCWFAALEAAGLVPPLDQLCTCPDVDITCYIERPDSRTVKGLDPACPIHGHLHEE
jgi:hypothetical protein